MKSPFPFSRPLGASIFAVLLICSSQAQEAAPEGPAPAGKPWEPAWGYWPKSPTTWHPTHWGLVTRAKAGGVDVLFLGDSLTKNWRVAGKEIWEEKYVPLKVLNAGMGGDTTRQTLWRLDHETMAGLQPRVVVLMIGVNNIFTGTGTNEEIAKGIGVVLEKVRTLSPTSKILLLGLLPLGNEAQAARVKAINAEIAAFAGPDVRFLDMGPHFRESDGRVKAELYTPDLVHLAAPGYAAWDQAMKPVLEEMLR